MSRFATLSVGMVIPHRSSLAQNVRDRLSTENVKTVISVGVAKNGIDQIPPCLPKTIGRLGRDGRHGKTRLKSPELAKNYLADTADMADTADLVKAAKM